MKLFYGLAFGTGRAPSITAQRKIARQQVLVFRNHRLELTFRWQLAEFWEGTPSIPFWIPAPVTLGAVIPHSDPELTRLYALGQSFSATEEIALVTEARGGSDSDSGRTWHWYGSVQPSG